MSHLDKQKLDVIERLKVMCTRCAHNEAHDCPVSRVICEIQSLRGIPIIVNDRLHHVMFS